MEGIMYFKKLVGKKCYLSPIDVNDAERFTEWLNDMEILTNLQYYSGIVRACSHYAKGYKYRQAR
jgi:hypothetical protein